MELIDGVLPSGRYEARAIIPAGARA